MRKIIVSILAAIAATGCFNEEIYDTELILIPAEQLESGDDFTTLEGFVAYAFMADTTQYNVVSYEDAVRGVVSNKETGVEIAPLAVAIPYDGTMDLEGAFTMHIEGLESVMLVVADTKNEAYAYSNYSIGLNLPNSYITISFRPWKEGYFTQSIWQFVNPEIEEEDEDDTEDTE